MRMRAASILVLVGLLASCQILLVDGRTYQPIAGVFDFTEMLPSSAVARLDGTWDWIPNRFLPPREPWDSAQALSVPVPSKWNDYKVEGKPYGSFGYGTYRIILRSQDLASAWAMKITSLGSAFELYANDQLLAKAGRLSDRPEGSQAAYAPQVVTLPASSGEWEVRLLVSNWEHRDGGLFYSLFFGRLNDLLSFRQNLLFLDIFIFASLLIMAIYNASLYFFLKRDKGPIYFSLICLLFAFRTILYGEYLILAFIPQLDWQLLQKLGYSTLYLAPMLFYLFLGELINRTSGRLIPRKVILTVSAVAGAATLFTVSTPMVWFSQLQTVYQIWIAILFFLMLYYLHLSIRKGFREGYWFLVGVAVLFLTVVNDILHTSHLINTTHLSSIGFLAFLVSQSFLLTQNYSQAFHKIDRLSESLRQINQSLARFVPVEFLRYLGKESITDIQLGDHAEHRMSILFADIRSFTQLSEKMKPSENFHFINSYLRRMTLPIRDHHGFIDKYLGDGIMALFPNRADDAVRAGLGMLEHLQLYNQHRRSSGYEPIDIGIGIHTGVLMMGTVGSDFRMDSTVISDAVNLASRLEDLNRLFGTHLLVSLETLQELTDAQEFLHRLLGLQSIRGKEDPIPIFEIYHGDPDEVREQKKLTQPRFEEAIHLVLEEKFSQARRIFRQLVEQAPLDPVVHYYHRLLSSPRRSSASRGSQSYPALGG